MLVQAFLVWGGFYGKTRFSSVNDKGSIAKQIIGYAIPIFIGYLFQQLYNTVDALIVGNFLGQDALAAVTSVGSLIFCLLVFSMVLRQERVSLLPMR